MDDRTGSAIAPLCFALGVAVLLVGLVVDPLVIAPLGGAITIDKLFRANVRPRRGKRCWAAKSMMCVR